MRAKYTAARVKNVLVALAVALVLGGGAIYLQTRPATERPAPSPVAVNAPDPAPVDPAPYLAAFPLTPLEAPAPGSRTPSGRAVDKALVPYRKGDYAAAASALDGVRLDYPDDPAAALYLGISRLYIDEPQNALEILRTLPPAPPEIQGQAAWYSLVGIARLRDPSHVEAEADALCTSSLPTASRACAALESLTKARRNPPPRP
jgi:Tetratricopeptide repeat